MHKTMILACLIYLFCAATPVKAVSFPVFPTFAPCFPFCPVSTITPSPTPTLPMSPSPTPVVQPTANPTLTPNSGIKYGAYVGDGIENLNNVNSFQSMTGKKLDAILVYEAWEGDWKDFRPQWITNAYQNGSIPMITWEPWNYSFGVNQPTYRLANITAGAFDTHITNYAKAAKATGKEIYLRPMHEMNGNWYPWAEAANGNKPGDYVKAWKHIVDIFRAQDATNVKYVWCPNVTYSGSTPLAGLFPGDDYVDFVCMDGYNWGTTNGGWQEFTSLFTSTYNQITLLSSKSVIIGEMASAEQGGSKANWITTAYKSFFPKVVLVNWFNANKEKDWRVNSSNTSLNAFKAAIK